MHRFLSVCFCLFALLDCAPAQWSKVTWVKVEKVSQTKAAGLKTTSSCFICCGYGVSICHSNHSDRQLLEVACNLRYLTVCSACTKSQIQLDMFSEGFLAHGPASAKLEKKMSGKQIKICPAGTNNTLIKF